MAPTAKPIVYSVWVATKNATINTSKSNNQPRRKSIYIDKHVKKCCHKLGEHSTWQELIEFKSTSFFVYTDSTVLYNTSCFWSPQSHRTGQTDIILECVEVIATGWPVDPEDRPGIGRKPSVAQHPQAQGVKGKLVRCHGGRGAVQIGGIPIRCGEGYDQRHQRRGHQQTDHVQKQADFVLSFAHYYSPRGYGTRWSLCKKSKIKKECFDVAMHSLWCIWDRDGAVFFWHPYVTVMVFTVWVALYYCTVIKWRNGMFTCDIFGMESRMVRRGVTVFEACRWTGGKKTVRARACTAMEVATCYNRYISGVARPVLRHELTW